MNEKETNISRLRMFHEKRVYQKIAAPEITDHLSGPLCGQILENTLAL